MVTACDKSNSLSGSNGPKNFVHLWLESYRYLPPNGFVENNVHEIINDLYSKILWEERVFVPCFEDIDSYLLKSFIYCPTPDEEVPQPGNYIDKNILYYVLMNLNIIRVAGGR